MDNSKNLELLKIMKIPVGAYNIKIREARPSRQILSKYWYGHLYRSAREHVNLSKTLSIFLKNNTF